MLAFMMHVIQQDQFTSSPDGYMSGCWTCLELTHSISAGGQRFMAVVSPRLSVAVPILPLEVLSNMFRVL